MKILSTLLLLLSALLSYSQITLSPNSGCPGSTFQITITGTVNMVASSPCSAVTGVFSNNVQVIAVNNPQQTSSPYTVSVTIPANFAPGSYDFRLGLGGQSTPCFQGSCTSCFTVNSKPTSVSISPSGAITKCQGESVNLICSSSGATSYQWKLDGSDISNDTLASTTVSTSGSYNCVAINTCGNTASDTAIITYSALPLAATITANGSVLSANSAVAVAYQWYLGANAINNEIDSVYTASADGQYSVEITDANGCKSTSAPFSYTHTGIENLANSTFSLTPNPASGFVTITTGLNSGFTAYIISAQGQTMDVIQSKNTSVQVDVSKLSKGIYLVKLKTATGEIQKRLTIQ